MKTRGYLILAAIAFAFALLLFIPYSVEIFKWEVWERQNPLVNPVAVLRVDDGTLTLADGRKVRLAGIRRLDSVSSADYDRALRIIASQGVSVVRDLGDGRVLLLAEPKFYNWCGTPGYKGNPWARWAGSYLQWPASELLIYAGYARCDPEEPGLSNRELWRLEGVSHVDQPSDLPIRVSPELNALEFRGYFSHLSNDFDRFVEVAWKPPPEQVAPDPDPRANHLR